MNTLSSSQRVWGPSFDTLEDMIKDSMEASGNDGLTLGRKVCILWATLFYIVDGLIRRWHVTVSSALSQAGLMHIHVIIVQSYRRFRTVITYWQVTLIQLTS